MALKTTLEQLEEVQAAITRTLNMEAYTLADQQVQRARLAELTARENMLLGRREVDERRNPHVSAPDFSLCTW
jgi:diphthamide biosynthesis methyltransferase